MFQRRDINLIYWGTLISFVLVKPMLRPIVLKMEAPLALDIFVLSYPNFCEGVVGVFVLSMLLMQLSKRRLPKNRKLKDRQAYLIALLLATVFVTTQEMELHSLGGNNIYDPYDLLFSGLGLLFGYICLLKIRPSLTEPYKGRILRY